MTTEANQDSEQDQDGHTVLALLEHHIATLEQLEQLSQRQRDLIVHDDTRALMSVLSRRRDVTSELSVLCKRLEVIRRNWSEIRRGLNPDEDQRAQAMLAEVASRMNRVIEADAEDARLLEIRKHQAGSDVASMVSARGALSAYVTDTTHTGQRVEIAEA